MRVKNDKKENKGLRRLAFGAIASLGVLSLVFGCIFAYFSAELYGGREVMEIPSFVGKRFENVADVDGIRLESELVFSPDVPEGEIISQFPYAGARRKVVRGEKCTVKLTVSAGKQENRLPSLEGYQYTSAAAVLRSMGAEIRILSVYDDEKEPDVVLHTSPAAGTDIERGDVVTLFVSRRHIHGSVKVKRIVGLPIDEATTEILAQGLTLGEIKQEYSNEYCAGVVISQSVSEGSYVLYGSSVDLTVSAGRKIERLHPFRGDITEENGEINESVD